MILFGCSIIVVAVTTLNVSRLPSSSEVGRAGKRTFLETRIILKCNPRGTWFNDFVVGRNLPEWQKDEK